MTSSIENLFVTPPGLEAAKLTSRIQMAENLGRDSIRAADGKVDIEDMHRRKVARDFESIFIRQIIDRMKETIPESDLADSSSEQIQSMYWSFLGDAIAEKGGFGLWKQIYEQMPKSSQAAAELGAAVDAAKSQYQAGAVKRLDEIL
jgi:Rod binding domain-containing protein